MRRQLKYFLEYFLKWGVIDNSYSGYISKINQRVIHTKSLKFPFHQLHQQFTLLFNIFVTQCLDFSIHYKNCMRQPNNLSNKGGKVMLQYKNCYICTFKLTVFYKLFEQALVTWRDSKRVGFSFPSIVVLWRNKIT